jgi:hypothetical protein
VLGVLPPNENVDFGASAVVVDGFVLALERPGLLGVGGLRPENILVALALGAPPGAKSPEFGAARFCAGFEGANVEAVNPPLVPPNNPGVWEVWPLFEGGGPAGVVEFGKNIFEGAGVVEPAGAEEFPPNRFELLPDVDAPSLF